MQVLVFLYEAMSFLRYHLTLNQVPKDPLTYEKASPFSFYKLFLLPTSFFPSLFKTSITKGRVERLGSE